MKKILMMKKNYIPAKKPDNIHKVYPNTKSIENDKSPFLTPILSTKKPPKRGNTIFGKE
jgi:hypothetical protein